MSLFAEEVREVIEVVKTDNEYLTVHTTSFYRSFCSVLEDEHLEDVPLIKDNTSGLDLVRQGVIGRLAPFDTPYGYRPIVYADWTASGRGHKAVEEFICAEVLPLYGNTHTVRLILFIFLLLL